MNDKQKYEQVLKRAKDLLDNMDKGDYFASKADIENIFPELKESDDERIRKGLIKTISSLLDNTILYHTDITKEEALTWLEKQDKTLDADKVIAWLVANICHFDYYVKLFKKDFGL